MRRHTGLATAGTCCNRLFFRRSRVKRPHAEITNERVEIRTDFLSNENFVASRERGPAAALRFPLPHRADARGLPVRRILVHPAVATGDHPKSAAPPQAQRPAPRDPALSRSGRRHGAARVLPDSEGLQPGAR